MRTSALGLLAATAALAIAASTAHAADLPGRYSPAPAYNALPVFTWTGFYAGLNAGYGWNAGDSRYYDPAFGTVSGRRGGGFVGGAQAGYNYQFGMFVAGAETDLQYAAVGNKGASYGTIYYPGESDGFFGTIRARAGVAFDRALVYGTGGFAYGDIGGNRGYDPLLGYHRNTPSPTTSLPRSKVCTSISTRRTITTAAAASMLTAMRNSVCSAPA
jgi:outer membrane immunogenic protein